MFTFNLSPAEVTRYSRQMALEGWGREAQERLKSSRVLLAGIGGLASTVALQLLASGVGALRLVDGSRVTLEDLNHQVLFRERDLGKAKATVAEQRLRELNPFVLLESHTKTISGNNLSRLASSCHLLLDTTNHLPTGQILNQGAAKLRLPLVHAAVWGMQGRIATFWPGRGPCLTCAFPEPAFAGPPPLLGPLPGILGALQALEALRILGGLGPALLGKILTFQGDRFKFREDLVHPASSCPTCRLLQT